MTDTPATPGPARIPSGLADLLAQAGRPATPLSARPTRCPGSGTLTTSPSTIRARVTITTTIFLPVSEGDSSLAIDGYGDERAWYVVEDALEASLLELVTESSLAQTLDFDDTAVTVAGEIKLLNPPPLPSAPGPSYYHPNEEIL